MSKQLNNSCYMVREVYESETKYYLVPVMIGKGIEKADSDDESWDIRELGETYENLGGAFFKAKDANAFAKAADLDVIDEVEQVFY